MTLNGTSVTERSTRIDWVDYAKGICIVMVVMMHSVLGVEKAAGDTGFMHAFVMFAQPFRMPDFFLISGLFLAVVIDRDWRTYLDRKVVHFAYFYVLWMTIQFGFKAPGFAAESGWRHVGLLYLESFVEPFGTLWFIYLLPMFFVVTKLSRGIPAMAVWLVAAALEMAHVATGWTVIDEFCARFVYFYSGYLFASYVFALSDRSREKPALALIGLALWTLVNGGLVVSGVSHWPLISLALGFAGAGAIIVMGTLLARMQWLNFLRYCGEHSIVIYLAFFLPMAVTRTLLLKTGLITDIGTISLIVTVAGVAGAVVIWRLALALRADFLFERPAAFWIAPKKAASGVAAGGVGFRTSLSSPANAGTHDRAIPLFAGLLQPAQNLRLWLWIPARASLGRDDEMVCGMRPKSTSQGCQSAQKSLNFGHAEISPQSTPANPFPPKPQPRRPPSNPARATMCSWSTVPPTFSAPITRCRP